MRKAIIPVAGMGSRLRPHTHTQPKPMMPVAGKPILGHIIDDLLHAGIQHQVFVLGYLGDKIREYVEHDYKGKVFAEFVIQEPRRGLAQAIGLCQKELANVSELMIVLGDTIFGREIERILECPFGNVVGVHEVDEPRKFGIAVIDAEQNLTSAVEKPLIPVSNLAMVGLYKIQKVALLMECILEMQKEKLGENEQYLLTDAIMRMIEKGTNFKVFEVENWYDCGNRISLLETNRILLERPRPEHSHTFENTVILPPVHIADGCHIKNSIIGPYAAIAEHTHIANSIVKDSIIGAYSELDYIILNKSVLGNDTILKGKAHSVNIGDNTEIDFDE